LTNVFTFSLSIVGELPFPGLKVAATVLLDIIRRVGVSSTFKSMRRISNTLLSEYK
jgi:hypothetical protein